MSAIAAMSRVVLRVTPPVRPHHPDLPAPHRVPKRHQHAQLVRDALDPSLVVHRRRPPVLGHHPRERHALRRIEERALLQRLVQVALEQVDRVHHRPVGGVVALQLQRAQQRREHPAPVRRARRPQHRTNARLVGGPRSPRPPSPALSASSPLRPPHRDDHGHGRGFASRQPAPHADPVVLSNPSSGGVCPAPLLPAFGSAIGQALPPGAGTTVVRNTVYFSGHATTQALSVLAA